jgi:hypothetical protein
MHPHYAQPASLAAEANRRIDAAPPADAPLSPFPLPPFPHVPLSHSPFPLVQVTCSNVILHSHYAQPASLAAGANRRIDAALACRYVSPGPSRSQLFLPFRAGHLRQCNPSLPLRTTRFSRSRSQPAHRRPPANIPLPPCPSFTLPLPFRTGLLRKRDLAFPLRTTSLPRSRSQPAHRRPPTNIPLPPSRISLFHTPPSLSYRSLAQT